MGGHTTSDTSVQFFSQLVAKVYLSSVPPDEQQRPALLSVQSQSSFPLLTWARLSLRDVCSKVVPLCVRYLSLILSAVFSMVTGNQRRSSSPRWGLRTMPSHFLRSACSFSKEVYVSLSIWMRMRSSSRPSVKAANPSASSVGWLALLQSSSNLLPYSERVSSVFCVMWRRLLLRRSFSLAPMPYFFMNSFWRASSVRIMESRLGDCLSYHVLARPVRAVGRFSSASLTSGMALFDQLLVVGILAVVLVGGAE
uniref:Uncharacterized protein n=1 Tax=Chromera velia CCMP2878 TaxID=1169474 RepID=A0A0K6S9H7_9ALVE|eukprot:Cvel_28675.t2-p1 / transcript=Cvel_28675.t2 / gene=Cvel_28675 / organism=Chromera_velia_CCMP2878 / gene_product=hypothetical protein / transcript_product=hypothetical protein / location=Cvel_scaffold3801:2432-6241(-) / protein_length=252 / sequence_SO=supercontig / SO=protein_coding / is_pseudo=false